MRKVLTLVFAVLAFGAVACGTVPASATGTRIQVAGGYYANVTPAGLKQMLAAKDFLLVNVHIPYAGELAQTDAFIPYTEIEQSTKLPGDKNAKLVLYCSSGHMSGIAANALVQTGFTNVWNLEGGMIAWQNAGFALIQAPK